MDKKLHLSHYLQLTFIFAVCMCLSACGTKDSDDEDLLPTSTETPKNIQQCLAQISGTWLCVSQKIWDSGDIDTYTYVPGDDLSMRLDLDGTGYFIINRVEPDRVISLFEIGRSSSFSWSMTQKGKEFHVNVKDHIGNDIQVLKLVKLKGDYLSLLWKEDDDFAILATFQRK